MEEHIREPDNQIRDRLFQSYWEIPERVGIERLMRSAGETTEGSFVGEYTEEDRLQQVLEESESDFEYHVAVLESKRIAKEREERAEHFGAFKTKIIQFMRIDTSNHAFYSELIGYIDKYESGELQMVKVNNDFYMKYFYTINNMRIKQEDKARLFEFIQILVE